jgi:hypothetical protein
MHDGYYHTTPPFTKFTTPAGVYSWWLLAGIGVNCGTTKKKKQYF